jgi:hypothetical protein
MTDQEIFDKVAQHLLAQGRPARAGDTCRYRAPDGSKCAIGCLIEDDQYAPRMEGIRLKSLADRYSGRLRNILNRTHGRRMFLVRLQIVHDDCKTALDGTFDPKDLHERLRRVAEAHMLSAAVLDTAIRGAPAQ